MCSVVASIVDLSDQHQDALQHVERLEAATTTGFSNSSAKNALGCVPITVLTCAGPMKVRGFHRRFRR
jgi:hypothetical protein